jgi:hypothetical protein
MRTLLAVALLVPSLALAQESAPQLQEDPRALLDTPTADRERFRLAGESGGRAGGMLVGAMLGMDLGSRLSVAVFAQGGNQQANANYGAFRVLALGADVRLALVGWRDRNDWERLFLYVHGRGGYATTRPEGLFGTNDVLLAAGPGIEYFTKLRHFSIGIATDAVYAVEAGVFGFSIYPTLRYTF